LPIRELDWFVPARAARARILSQRGVNGIDGLISSAAGAAYASGERVTLLLGDVSFVHDVGGLWTARSAGVALTVVVLDNGGGRIFELLPRGELADAPGAFDAWLTPPAVDFGQLSSGFGHAYFDCGTLVELESALNSALQIAETTVVRARVVPESALDAHRALALAISSPPHAVAAGRALR
jgi:2-succinyl-5-enolpyruvyl-6-hydroxy-3-cyclohexene-1-carboxylate synthase